MINGTMMGDDPISLHNEPTTNEIILEEPEQNENE